AQVYDTWQWQLDPAKGYSVRSAYHVIPVLFV
ncbi:hypothetical protein A2U01_0111088, partial [Trifolium medium]|nr:hypothetical protein [Trifolium medium]